MLDSETKRKIDSARQILVGKVPDPKAQVEQITTALIYKFMDDMDEGAKKIGGRATFFKGDLKDFAWSKLLDTKCSGQERLDLYVRAIKAFTKAKQLPPLFRNIFKDAFLPYSDPETLSLFLKEINNFTYENSENLGNAFEYLLSILGSQGDAGQFRTPRHIIDFIVTIVDPKKNETILDPACGTTGFLISAYKHILKQNSSKESYRGDLLTPSARTKLMNNFDGYDIDPVMVKLSLVNMYLHGFKQPKICEHDTLTSEKYWDDQFDVILANPPFITPKGGIRPHKRFSVQAKRCEVLFVDYILEHLSLKGRAGIIVPEGIVFNTQKAYKQLRQLLVGDGLFAVVSLPQGVFYPYTGVKTSILFFDSQLAKKNDEILFVKIENDGFDLGAKRRKIDEDDLPKALETLESWKQGKKKKSNLALWVKKEKIAENGDYALVGERYQKTEIQKDSKWPMVKLKEVCEIFNGSRPKGGAVSDGILSIGGEHINSDGSFKLENPKYIPENFFKELRRGKLEIGDVLVVKDGATTGKMGYFDKNSPFRIGAVNEHVFILRANTKKIIPFYLYQFLKSKKGNAEILKCKMGTAQGGINLSIKEIKIPLPPLEVQKEIVEQIETKQNAIDHAKEIIKSLERERQHFGRELRKLEKVNKWPLVDLGEICEIERGKTITKNKVSLGDIPVIAGGQKPAYYHNEANIEPPVITISGSGAYAGFVNLFEIPIWASDCITIQIKDEKISKLHFVYRVLKSQQEDIYKLQSGLAQPHVYPRDFIDYKIPLPPLEIQKQFVAEAEKVEEIIASNRKLINIMEEKINSILEEFDSKDTKDEKSKYKIWDEIIEADGYAVVKYNEYINFEKEFKKWLSTKISSPIVSGANAGEALHMPEEDLLGYIVFDDKESFDINTNYVIQIDGDSMNNKKINGKFIEHGDYVIVDSDTQPETGDVVVSIVDNAVNIKELHKESGKIFLKSKSKSGDYDDIQAQEDYICLGKVVRVLK